MCYTGTLRPASNRSSYDQTIEIMDPDSNLLSLTGKTFAFEVADKTGSTLISATLANGKLTSPSLGTLRLLIPRSEMRSLCVGEYKAGFTWSDGTQTKQIFAGTLPVNDGVVT